MKNDAICTLVQTTDYIHAECSKCGAICNVDYKGMGLMVPQLQFTCPTCGDLGTFKLDTLEPGWTKHSMKVK